MAGRLSRPPINTVPNHGRSDLFHRASRSIFDAALIDGRDNRPAMTVLVAVCSPRVLHCCLNNFGPEAGKQEIDDYRQNQTSS